MQWKHDAPASSHARSSTQDLKDVQQRRAVLDGEAPPVRSSPRSPARLRALGRRKKFKASHVLTTHMPLFAAARGAAGRRGAPQGGGRAHGTGYVPGAIPRQLLLADLRRACIARSFSRSAVRSARRSAW